MRFYKQPIIQIAFLNAQDVLSISSQGDRNAQDDPFASSNGLTGGGI